MYPNIDAEQARLKLTNEAVAGILHITPYTYGQKKLKCKFTAKEAQTLCVIFQKPFEYLFETKDREEA